MISTRQCPRCGEWGGAMSTIGCSKCPTSFTYNAPQPPAVEATQSIGFDEVSINGQKIDRSPEARISEEDILNDVKLTKIWAAEHQTLIRRLGKIITQQREEIANQEKFITELRFEIQRGLDKIAELKAENDRILASIARNQPLIDAEIELSKKLEKERDEARKHACKIRGIALRFLANDCGQGAIDEFNAQALSPPWEPLPPGKEGVE